MHFNELIFNVTVQLLLISVEFYSCTMNNMINCLHKRYSYRTHSDKTSFFENFLGTDKSVLIPIGNLQILATGILNINRALAPTIFGELFEKQNMQYNWRRALSCLGPKIGDIALEELKDFPNIVLK